MNIIPYYTRTHISEISGVFGSEQNDKAIRERSGWGDPNVSVCIRAFDCVCMCACVCACTYVPLRVFCMAAYASTHWCNLHFACWGGSWLRNKPDAAVESMLCPVTSNSETRRRHYLWPCCLLTKQTIWRWCQRLTSVRRSQTPLQEVGFILSGNV